MPQQPTAERAAEVLARIEAAESRQRALFCRAWPKRKTERDARTEQDWQIRDELLALYLMLDDRTVIPF